MWVEFGLTRYRTGTRTTGFRADYEEDADCIDMRFESVGITGILEL